MNLGLFNSIRDKRTVARQIVLTFIIAVCLLASSQGN